MRFDEMELESVPLADALPASGEVPEGPASAPRLKRLLALFTDLSLFVALALALSPLLPSSNAWPYVASLAGFVIVVSYYYFVGSWMLWGKTIGGAIFDVRVIASHDADSGHNPSAMSLKDASLRWLGVYASLLTAGLGFAAAALPSARSLPDQLSDTRCISSR